MPHNVVVIEHVLLREHANRDVARAHDTAIVGEASPARSLSNVDLPSPLRPTMPMRSPELTPSVRESKIRAVGYSSWMFSQPRRYAMRYRPRSRPQKKRATVPGPVWLPMVVPML